MPDRLREFLDRPLERRSAVAVLLFACAITLVFAAVIVLGLNEAAPTAPKHTRSQVLAPPERFAPIVEVPSRNEPVEHGGQDPQDDPTSPAGRRAARALRESRALQHVPYRRGTLGIDLVGAENGRAVLRVTAPDLAAAKRGWAQFLRRHRDAGHRYLVRFRPGGGAR